MVELDDLDDHVYFERVLIILPILTVFMSATACLLGYLVAVETGSVKPYPHFPFISELGDLRPESNIYNFFMIISCFATSYIIIIRYFQVKETYTGCYMMNQLSTGFGAAFVIGKIMAASFQKTCLPSLHYIGAAIFFLGATAYMTSQVYMTYKTLTRSKMYLLIIRIICFVGMSVSIIIFSVFLIKGRFGRNVAVAAEWCMAIFKMTFMLTFLGDFWQQKMRLQLNFYTERIISMGVK